MAPVAVEWFADASPKLHTTSASAGQRDRRVQLAGPADGEGHAQRPRQVGRDGGGLRDDGQVGVAEHLVAPAGHGFVGRRQHALEDVGDRIVARHLAGSGHVEPAAAVVEQGRVGGPEGAGDGGVGLVARRADRVEATALERSQRAARSRWRLVAWSSNSARRRSASASAGSSCGPSCACRRRPSSASSVASSASRPGGRGRRSELATRR